MIVVAKTLDLMDHWLLYFFFTLVVTFVVTAITVHLPPLRSIPDTYFPGATPQPEEKVTKHRFRVAWREAKATLAETPSLGRNLWVNFRDGLLMASSILPSILSVGLIGLLLAKYTPIFDWLGWIFVPFTWVTQLSDPVLAGKASALGIVEMFLPATQSPVPTTSCCASSSPSSPSPASSSSPRWCPRSSPPRSRSPSARSSSSGSNASCSRSSSPPRSPTSCSESGVRRPYTAQRTRTHLPTRPQLHHQA